MIDISQNLSGREKVSNTEECSLEKSNLVEIFEKGVRGEIPDMTKQDWELVYYLVNESIKTNRAQACREQYVQLRRDGKLNF